MMKFIKVLLSKPSRLIFGLSISFLTLYLAFRTLNYGDFIGVFSSVNWMWIFGSILMIILHHLSKTLRWKVLVDQNGTKIGFRPILASLMVSQMINLVVPARAGDLSRIQQIGLMGPGRSFMFVTLVVEKVFDMVAYGILLIVLIISISLPQWINNTGILFLILAATLFSSMLIAFKYRQKIFLIIQALSIKIPVRYRDFVLGKVKTIISGLSVIENRRILLIILFWTTISWLASILVNYCLLVSMELNLSWTAPLLILLGLQAGISIPSVPMKIGIFEYICVLVLAIYGVSQVTSLSYGILLHLLVILPILGSGLYFLVVSDRSYPGGKGSESLP
jgi:glycosyltransferase 2 family protein